MVKWLAELLASYGALARRMKPDVVTTQVQTSFEKTREALDRIRAVELPPKVMIVTIGGSQRLRVQGRFIEAVCRRGSPRGLRLRSDRRARRWLAEPVFDHAENRLHAWKALLYLLLGC